jgi:Flp pilus assembly protein CpaB
MLTLDGKTRGPEAGDDTPRLPPRSLGSSRRLAGSRSILGGFLVATAAVATFATYTQATATHQVRYVVATHALTIGQHLTAGDLSTEEMSLPRTTSPLAFTSPEQLLRSVVVAPLRSGEIVQASDVAKGSAVSSPRQLSFSIDPSRAVDGSLQIGDRVDLLATFGSGSSATTTIVASNLQVLGKHDDSGALAPASGATEVLTVGIDPPNDPLTVVQAVNTGQLVVVRTTGATPAPATGSPSPASASTDQSTTTTAPSSSPNIFNPADNGAAQGSKGGQ